MHWHDDVAIVGTIDALRSLILVLQQAVDGTVVPDHVFCVNDGEGFNVRVFEVVDDPRLAVPYTNPIAAEDRADVIWPHQLAQSPDKEP